MSDSMFRCDDGFIGHRWFIVSHAPRDNGGHDTRLICTRCATTAYFGKTQTFDFSEREDRVRCDMSTVRLAQIQPHRIS